MAVLALLGASCVATPGPHQGWAKYTIAPGSHSASVDANGAAASPIAGFTPVAGRDFRFFFDSSAKYVITNPTQPNDQFDYNKLPGFSDCGTVDLSQNGAMFGWRWRLDTSPKRLEIVHYANNNGTHLYPSSPLLSLSQAEVDGEHPLSYSVRIGGANNSKYLFRVSGSLPGRTVDVSAELPRQCPSTSTTATKWASGFYFGGTSTAPSTITGWIQEG
jgi:hypothetical protein